MGAVEKERNLEISNSEQRQVQENGESSAAMCGVPDGRENIASSGQATDCARPKVRRERRRLYDAVPHPPAGEFAAQSRGGLASHVQAGVSNVPAVFCDKGIERTFAEMSRAERAKTFALLIQDHLPLAARVGALALPLVDITALSFVQLSLLRKLARLYGYDFSEDYAQKIRVALISEVDPAEGISEGWNELNEKFHESPKETVQGMSGGSLNASVMSLCAAASTYALAKVVNEHFEGGGSLEEFPVRSRVGRFRELFREGRVHPLAMLELGAFIE